MLCHGRGLLDVRGLLPLLLITAASTPAAAGPPTRAASAEAARALRARATVALAHGDLEAADTVLADLLRLAPHDAVAHRDAGRVAFAVGQLDRAAGLLARADRLAEGRPDAELQYLLGEARYALGRPGAREAHDRALTALGKRRDRQAAVWRARIHARRRDIIRADALYRSLACAAAPACVEIAFAHAEAFTLVNDWPGAERVLRAFLRGQRTHVRAREMLAWVLEAQGKLEAERAVRAALADDAPSRATFFDYGRVLERLGSFRAALRAYRRARAFTPRRRDRVLDGALARVRGRIAPELTSSAVIVSEPAASAVRTTVGIAVPLARHQVMLLAQAVTVASDTAWTLAPTVVLRGRQGAAMTLGGQLVTPGTRRGVTAGGAVAARTPLGRRLRLGVRAELGTQWTEAAIAVREDGQETGVVAQLDVAPVARVAGRVRGQLRRLQLAPGDAASHADRPAARQAAFDVGADFVAWSNHENALPGAILDDRLDDDAFFADALVVGVHHREATTAAEEGFTRRIALGGRVRHSEGSLLLRKVLGDGRLGLEARGAVGRDFARDVTVLRAGGSVHVSVGARSRLTLFYDYGTETGAAVFGRQHLAGLSCHVDL